MIPVNTYDAVFQAEHKNIPIAYLKALANQESAMKADATNPTGKYVGLFQIGPDVFRDYLIESNQSLALDQRTDPKINTRIAVWYLNKIADYYAKNHPASFKADWNDDRFVGLLTQGYNAGHTDTNGVSAIVGKMEAQKISSDRITYQTVAEANKALKINPWLGEPGRLSYVARVIRDYRDQPASGKTENFMATHKKYLPWVLGGTVLIGAVTLYVSSK